MASVKEPHFFANLRPDLGQRQFFYPVTDEKKYLRLFSNTDLFPAVGEASPSYLVTREAAERIKARIPNARIIILLRDPVERAFSHYLMDVRDGAQSLGFYDAVVRDHEMPRKEWGFSRLYVEEGLYYRSVQRFVDLFGPANVAVYLFESLAEDPRAVVSRALRFLGLDPAAMSPGTPFKVYNSFSLSRNGLADRIVKSRWVRLYAAPLLPSGWRAKLVRAVLHKRAVKPPMDPIAIKYLQPLFADDITQLERFLGYRLPFYTTKGEQPMPGQTTVDTSVITGGLCRQAD